MTSIVSKMVVGWRRAKDRRRQRTLPTTIWLHLVAALEESGRGNEDRPNEYQVILPAADRDLLPEKIATLEQEMSARLEQEAQDRGRRIAGPVKVSITFGSVDKVEVKTATGTAAIPAEVDKDTTIVFHLRQQKQGLTILPVRSLIVLDGSDKGATFTLWGDKVLVGRRETNHVVLHDDKVSRVHLAITWADGQDYVEDLDSLNGTWLNGYRFQGKKPLQAGDRIVLGSTTLEYRG
jgi:hypothetical protein